MIGVLRAEEKEDNEHRDRCENGENANKNELEDLAANIEKTKKSIKRMKNTADELEGEIKVLKGDIKATKKDMAELLKMRNEEVAEFRQALKDDSDSVALIKKAIVALSKYYKNNKIAMPAMLQKNSAPEYAEDPDKAPDATFASSDSRKSETGGILAILEMLAEDLEKEMAEGRADDAEAQAKYDEQSSALQKSLDAQSAQKASTETELGDLEEKISQYEDHQKEKEADEDAEEDT